MRGILIDPGCAPEIRKLPNTAQGLNAFLGGEVQIYRFGSVFAALVYTHQAHQAFAQPALHRPLVLRAAVHRRLAQ